MLRGINVSGQKSVKMEQLRESFQALNFQDVQTYVQSGNVVFKAPKQSSEKLSQRLEEIIRKDFGFSVPVIVRTSDELNETIQKNPFVKLLKGKPTEPPRLYVTFLSEAPKKLSVEALSSLSSKPDQFHFAGKEIYLFCGSSYGKSKLSNNAFEKVLSVDATTRNWNTVNRLYEMSL